MRDPVASIRADGSRTSNFTIGTRAKWLGFIGSPDDKPHYEAILKGAGGVPLAIKWAAQIAFDRKSLRDASSVLRGAGAGKKELLSFCFNTMFDALSETAKNAARLVPYLGAEWKPITISIALDIPIDAARMAIYELSRLGSKSPPA